MAGPRDGRHRALVLSGFVDVLTLVRARLDAHCISYQYLDASTPRRRPHSKLHTTQRYVHATGADLRDAIARLPGN